MREIDPEFIASRLYEAARREAQWSNRPVVPEPWEERDEAFRSQFVDLLQQYLSAPSLPTPEEAHESWMEAYFKMGWKYGPTRDPVTKTHPDLVPFDQLPKDERDKDAIFLALVWLAKELVARRCSRSA